MLLMATINQGAIKTALSLSPFTDALTLAAEKCLVYLYKARTIASKLRLDKGSENRSNGFNALLSPTASWGRGSSEDGHVWAVNFQSGMCTFLCNAVFFLHQNT